MGRVEGPVAAQPVGGLLRDRVSADQRRYAPGAVPGWAPYHLSGAHAANSPGRPTHHVPILQTACATVLGNA